MFVNNHVENFYAHYRHLTYRLRSRILNSDNSIVICLNDVLISEVDACGPRCRSHCMRCEMAMTGISPPGRLHLLGRLYSWLPSSLY